MGDDQEVVATVNLWQLIKEALPKSTIANQLRRRITNQCVARRPTERTALSLSLEERSAVDMALDQVGYSLDQVRLKRELGIKGDSRL